MAIPTFIVLLCMSLPTRLLIAPVVTRVSRDVCTCQQVELQRKGAEMASRARQHDAELASKAADMAALTQQHASAQHQAAQQSQAELAAAVSKHAQQLQQVQQAAEKEAADADDRLQDVKDLLVALQARFNNR